VKCRKSPIALRAMASGLKKFRARKEAWPTSSLGAKSALEEMEKLNLSVTVPSDINGHRGNGYCVHDDGNETRVLQLIDGVQALGHTGLRINDARVMSVVMQVNVMVVMVFQPAAVKIEPNDSCNEDDQGHNVVREIHKRLPFLSDLQVRRAIVRGVTDSFAGMILLFGSEYKGVDGTLYDRRAKGAPGKLSFSPGRLRDSFRDASGCRMVENPAGQNLLKSN